jgi:GGDEF domain-containing protein
VGSEQSVIAVGDARFALVLEEHDRSEATSVARGLLDAARRKGEQSSTSPIKISLGVATLALPPRNFPERELVEAARRCLHAAQTSGGDAVKSIEI